MEGAHPAIMKKLMETNLEKTVGYGQDPYTEDAKEKIRKACNAPEAEVFLLVGGTQTNATVFNSARFMGCNMTCIRSHNSLIGFQKCIDYCGIGLCSANQQEYFCLRRIAGFSDLFFRILRS